MPSANHATVDATIALRIETASQKEGWIAPHSMPQPMAIAIRAFAIAAIGM